MKCSCCGKELLSTDRFCSNCGQNNEYYVEPVNNVAKEENRIQQPINRVPIQREDNSYQNYTQPSNYNQSNNQNLNNYQNSYQQPPQVVVVQQTAPEGCGLAVWSLIFGLLGGWLGLLFGIIGLCKYKESGNRTMCVIGIIAWLVWVVILIVIIVNYNGEIY